MDQRMTHSWLVLLCASLCSAAPVSESLVVQVGPPDSVPCGHTTVLPCWLSPPQNAEDLEVRWYRGDHFDHPIILYQAKKFDGSQDASYDGRVSFGLKDAASGGLKSGDVSLKLVNVSIVDVGEYTCYVSSDQGYDSSSLRLSVTETGSPPLLSAVWKDDNMLNLSCESEGWYPQPVLRWSDGQRDLTPKSLVHHTASSGFRSVHSWLLVRSSSEVSCSVGLTTKETKEARLHLGSPPQPKTGSSVGGWVAFVLLLIAVLAVLGVIGVMYFKKKVKGKKSRSESKHTDENEPLLPKDVVQPTALSTANTFYVNIKLVETENKYLKIVGSILRDGDGPFPDGKRVTRLTAIRGTPGFSGGQHYWEVSLGKTGFLKHSWWVGVTSAAEIPHDFNVSTNTSTGFWFLSSSSSSEDCLQFSTEPKVSLPAHERLQTVGVYLNYDSGELSFYNVEAQRLIGSFTATFTGEVFPLFNPGKDDKGSMEILQRAEQTESNDHGNSVDLAEGPSP
ncbi:butyrophilin subfamily 2 member A2-like isoform X1 [Embiotoca jacksoni]|uniref:butyrophilin subfamily 2 member A2-like isoform X1 n=2 Tax=Embiotoca jacksoni TaxID=100190 RepID=UPI0037037E70